ncbi:hypothetical protein KP004_06035 [Geomonas oryzisoli]|uniref:PEP-CTERM sorting domain-containing protein n=1 Tax=Geomonas oryzisoli TaxID=2847992 RepID=A0ABX8JDI1_9BACT|nr:hypothetical protein [Geomonas oryzisoli]QWV94734.1 hypothetical protein KP004_06035 [Geomonas oryzisoli]
MKLTVQKIVESAALILVAGLNLCSSCWAGPPAPPVIPATPVGSAEMSAVTVAAVAAYGFWKSRK